MNPPGRPKGEDRSRGIGILGGTFDPVHYGHLRMADDTCAALALAEVRLIPAGNPYHRRADPSASRQDRLAMARLGVAEFPRLRVDSREADTDAPSYTVDTLAAIRPEVGETPLLLLLGADAFAGLDRWKDWQRLFELAHLVLIARPGFTMPALPPALDASLENRRTRDARLLTAGAGRIYEQPVVPQPISATAIRAMVRGGHRPNGLVPPAVIDYIETHGLYRP